MRPSLPSLPLDILQDIVVHACDAPPYGPPRALGALGSTCRALHDGLASVQPSICARVLAQQFDPPRMGTTLRSSCAEGELRQRVDTLRLLASGALADPNVDPQMLTDALARAMLMLLENAGRNIEHLRRARLLEQLMIFLQTRLVDVTSADNGWPRATELNSLALALTALLIRKADIENEASAVWGKLHDAIVPFALAAFRYPLSTAPTSRFDVAPLVLEVTVKYYGAHVALALPPVSISSILLLSIRMDSRPPEVPTFLPRSRAATLGPPPPRNLTQEDLLEVRACAAERLARAGAYPRQSWDAHWHRRVSLPSLPPPKHPRGAYKVGMLSGAWAGETMTICHQLYGEMRTKNRPPTSTSLNLRTNCFVSFREHYCIDPARALPSPAQSDGVRDAWLPPGFFWASKGGSIQVEAGSTQTAYTTFDASAPLDDERAWDPNVDVIITGETKERHALAWGHYQWIGRVRRTDGYIVLLRTNTDSRLPPEVRIWAGYVVGDRHFVGRLAPADDTTQWAAPAPFCLTKRVARSDEAGAD